MNCQINNPSKSVMVGLGQAEPGRFITDIDCTVKKKKNFFCSKSMHQKSIGSEALGCFKYPKTEEKKFTQNDTDIPDCPGVRYHGYVSKLIAIIFSTKKF